MIQRDGYRTIITPVGRVDATNAPQFADALNEALPGTRQLVMDFSKLEYISSSGLKVVMQAVKTMYGQGEMRIINVNENVYEILKITGFTGVCDVELQGSI